MLKILIMVIVTEGLTQLFFEAAPLQGIRRFLIRFTPFFRIDGRHVFECKYCTSVWVSVLTVYMYFNIENSIITVFCMFIVLHRLSNFLHLGFSLLRDIQLDKRASRN